jgi:hypothetical protein
MTKDILLEKVKSSIKDITNPDSFLLEYDNVIQNSNTNQ